MFDEIIEKLRENSHYIIIGAVAGFLLRNVIEEMVEGNELGGYDTGRIDDSSA